MRDARTLCKGATSSSAHPLSHCAEEGKLSCDCSGLLTVNRLSLLLVSRSNHISLRPLDILSAYFSPIPFPSNSPHLSISTFLSTLPFVDPPPLLHPLSHFTRSYSFLFLYHYHTQRFILIIFLTTLRWTWSAHHSYSSPSKTKPKKKPLRRPEQRKYTYPSVCISSSSSYLLFPLLIFRPLSVLTNIFVISR